MYRVLRIKSGRSGQFLGSALTDADVSALVQADMEHLYEYSDHDIDILSMYQWEAIRI